MRHSVSTPDVIARRHSVRRFRSDAVPLDKIEHALTLAGRTPSNCNTQPWIVHVVSGEMRNHLSAQLVAALQSGQYSPDFAFDDGQYTGVYGARRRVQGKIYYEALGIAKDDHTGRQNALLRNLEFFDAPHVALLFMPEFGGVREAADVGMFAQSFLLALEALGIQSCAQTVLGMFAGTIRHCLEVGVENRMLFGISFGYEDEAASVNRLKMPRAALSEFAHFRV